jgi:hypothetical protein
MVVSQSHFTTNGQAVLPSWCRAPLGPMTRFWLWSKQLPFCLSWGVHPLERTRFSFNRSQSLSVSSDIYICIDLFLHFIYRMSLYKPGLSRLLVRVRVTSQLTAGRLVSQSVSQSVLASGASGTHDQILVVVKTDAVLLVVGRSPCRQDGSVIVTGHSLCVK